MRELENIVERAVLSARELTQHGEIDEPRLARLLPELFEHREGPSAHLPVEPEDLRALGKAAQLTHVRQTLEACQGNHDEAARRLGISRTTLWRRLRG
ncbi:DNA-binding transcriptional regulator DhaR [compost metagenome]